MFLEEIFDATVPTNDAETFCVMDVCRRSVIVDGAWQCTGRRTYAGSVFAHMVLQRDHANPVWGWADAGEEVVVVLGEQTKKTTAGAEGKWRVVLDPLPAGGPHKIVIEGKNRIAIEDVLVGEVWVCSGQSNMAWTVGRTYCR